MSIAPTRTIPWIEFAPDISGVCRVAGTLLMTAKPTRIASVKIVRAVSRAVDLFGGHAWPPGLEQLLDGARRTTAPSLVMTVDLVTSSSKSRLRAPSLTIPSSSAEMLRA